MKTEEEGSQVKYGGSDGSRGRFCPNLVHTMSGEARAWWLGGLRSSITVTNSGVFTGMGSEYLVRPFSKAERVT